MQTASKILQTRHVVEKMGNYEKRLQSVVQIKMFHMLMLFHNI
jgi:hypothetical protein